MKTTWAMVSLTWHENRLCPFWRIMEVPMLHLLSYSPTIVLTIGDGTQECLWRCLGLSVSCCSKSRSVTFPFDGLVGFVTYGVRLPTILKVVEPKTSRERILVCYLSQLSSNIWCLSCSFGTVHANNRFFIS